MKRPKQPTPREVLIDLLGSGDFDHEIIDPAAAADLILQALQDANYQIVPAPWPGLHSL